MYANMKHEIAFPILLNMSTVFAVYYRITVETITDAIPVAKYEIPAKTAISPFEISRFFSIWSWAVGITPVSILRNIVESQKRKNKVFLVPRSFIFSSVSSDSIVTSLSFRFALRPGLDS